MANDNHAFCRVQKNTSAAKWGNKRNIQKARLIKPLCSSRFFMVLNTDATSAYSSVSISVTSGINKSWNDYGKRLTWDCLDRAWERKTFVYQWPSYREIIQIGRRGTLLKRRKYPSSHVYSNTVNRKEMQSTWWHGGSKSRSQPHSSFWRRNGPVRTEAPLSNKVLPAVVGEKHASPI